MTKSYAPRYAHEAAVSRKERNRVHAEAAPPGRRDDSGWRSECGICQEAVESRECVGCAGVGLYDIWTYRPAASSEVSDTRAIGNGSMRETLQTSNSKRGLVRSCTEKTALATPLS